MIQSMTAFARREMQTDLGTLSWEIRSVNHRYLELNARLPESLRCFEAQVRDYITKHINRGKIEASFNYQVNTSRNELQINFDLVRQLIAAQDKLGELSEAITPFRSVDILNWPGVVQTMHEDNEKLLPLMLNLLTEAVADLIKNRQREGDALRNLLLQRLDAMEEQLALLHKRIPVINQQVQKKLMLRLENLKIDYDPSRLEQEIALQLQKMDVSEELDRLKTHILEVKRIITEGGLAGRRLDFLMQELNREANTLGSKSIDTEMTNCSVELKVLIDQMREQVQNIE